MCNMPMVLLKRYSNDIDVNDIRDPAVDFPVTWYYNQLERQLYEQTAECCSLNLSIDGSINPQDPHLAEYSFLAQDIEVAKLSTAIIYIAII